jgi:anti-sigma factor RsiW
VTGPGPRGHLGDRLSALADGELDEREAAAARAHLADCDGCRAELRGIELVRSAVQGLPPVDPHLGPAISALADGELTAAEAALAAGHLERCPGCREELAQVVRLRAVVRALPVLAPPPGTLALPRSPGRRVADRPPTARAANVALPRRRRRAASALAAAAALAAVVGLVERPSPTPPARPPVAQLVALHTTSSPGADPVSGLATVVVPVSLGR